MSTESVKNDRVLTFTRVLDASREKIFRCWTEPELLKQWFTPPPWKTIKAEVDLRAGGQCTITMLGPEGQEVPNPGVYLDIVPGRKIVFTDAFSSAWEPAGKAFMVGEIVLEDENGKTRYTATVRHWTAEDCKQHEAMGFYEGWGIATNQLEALAQKI